MEINVKIDEQEQRQSDLVGQLEGALQDVVKANESGNSSPKALKPSSIRELDAMPSACRSDADVQNKVHPNLACVALSADEAHAAAERERTLRPYSALATSSQTGDEIQFIQDEAVRNQRAAGRHSRGILNATSCSAMLADEDHIFQAMWGASLRKSLPSCIPNSTALRKQWIADVLSGRMCARNWHEGSAGCVGQLVRPPQRKPGTAVIGMQDAVARHCNKQIGCASVHRLPLSLACHLASMPALALTGSNPQPSTCRTLEWTTCAVRGLLPGQAGREVTVIGAKNIDVRQLNENAPGFVYTARDAYALQLCLLSKLCKNAPAIFTSDRMWPFSCTFDDTWLREREGLFSLRRRGTLSQRVM